MKKKFIILYFIITFCISYGLGIVFRDQYLLGATTMYCGCIQAFFNGQGKWYGELASIFETALSSIICVLACMYGSAIFTVAIFLPLSIFSIINWKKHEQNSVVQVNHMTVKKSILTILIVAVCTIISAFLLSLIPTQRFAIGNSMVEIFNICGILLLALRYKEAYIVWIFCNITEIIIWAIMLLKGFSNNAIMMIIMSAIYMVLNIWGYIGFIKMRKMQDNSVNAINDAV